MIAYLYSIFLRNLSPISEIPFEYRMSEIAVPFLLSRSMHATYFTNELLRRMISEIPLPHRFARVVGQCSTTKLTSQKIF